MFISLFYLIGISFQTKIDIAEPAFPLIFLNFEGIFFFFYASKIKILLIFTYIENFIWRYKMTEKLVYWPFNMGEKQNTCIMIFSHKPMYTMGALKAYKSVI